MNASLRHVDAGCQRLVDDRLSARLRCRVGTKKKAAPPHSQEEKLALGRRLATARQGAGFTLDTAAAALLDAGHQIGRGAIGAWEVGRNVPDAIWIKRLARLYGCNLEALVIDEQRVDGTWPLGPKIGPALWSKLDPLVKARMLGAIEQILRDHREEQGKFATSQPDASPRTGTA